MGKELLSNGYVHPISLIMSIVMLARNTIKDNLKKFLTKPFPSDILYSLREEKEVSQKRYILITHRKTLLHTIQCPIMYIYSTFIKTPNILILQALQLLINKLCKFMGWSGVAAGKDAELSPKLLSRLPLEVVNQHSAPF